MHVGLDELVWEEFIKYLESYSFMFDTDIMEERNWHTFEDSKSTRLSC